MFLKNKQVNLIDCKILIEFLKIYSGTFGLQSFDRVVQLLLNVWQVRERYEWNLCSPHPSYEPKMSSVGYFLFLHPLFESFLALRFFKLLTV